MYNKNTEMCIRDSMEAVRKGKVAKGGFKPGWEEAMREHEVPDWYIESCRKIK